ncbi:dorsal-ventral patterning tolloid-like protein 1, partial [Mizuhopecten yessoensis]|uniref:dorsal-ventral patterning tolloid-like protein 1 n=1 Tax=Mizuhopecten yessoensis TaxID=6573 RepID=UPI000B45C24A
MWSLYILVLAGTAQLGIDAIVSCCDALTLITATVNELKTIRVTCTPEFTTSCKWVITAPMGTAVGVEFSQVIIGSRNQIIHSNEQGNQLASFQGESRTIPLTVGGTFSTIEILPDNSNNPPQGGEEVLEFKYIAAVQTTSSDTAAACSSTGETIDLETGNRCITSPLFPSNYPETETNCKWTIQTGGKIKYTMSFFHLEAESTCTDADFLSITVRGIMGQPECDRELQSETVIDLESPVVVDFHFDDSVSQAGFLMCFENIGILTKF